MSDGSQLTGLAVPWRRLHLSSLTQPFSIAVPLLFVAIAADSDALWGTAIAVSVALWIRWLVSYLSTRYQFSSDHIVLKTGIARKQEKVVPYERMHDINTVQDPLQRLFRVTTIQIQTAGGSGIDLELKGVKLRVVDELRDLKRKHDGSVESAWVDVSPDEIISETVDHTEDAELLKISWLDCLKLSLIRNPALALMTAGFFYFYNKFNEQIFRYAERLFKEYSEYATVLSQDYVDVSIVDRGLPWIDVAINHDANWMPLLILLLVLVVIFIIVVVGSSFVIMVALYHGFSLRISDDTLLVSAGSVIRTERKTPVYRVQFTRTIRTLRHRLMGVDSVYFNTSAASDGKGLLENMLARWLTPISTPAESQQVIEQVFSDISMEHGDWLGSETRAWTRRFKKHVCFFLPVAAAMLLTSVLSVVVVGIVLGFFVIEAKRFIASIEYQLSDDAILVNSGWWVHKSTIVPLSKVQQIVIRETYFDRRREMASLCIDTAGDTSAFTVEVPYLDSAKAHKMANRIYEEVHNREFEW